MLDIDGVISSILLVYLFASVQFDFIATVFCHRCCSSALAIVAVGCWIENVSSNEQKTPRNIVEDSAAKITTATTTVTTEKPDSSSYNKTKQNNNTTKQKETTRTAATRTTATPASALQFYIDKLSYKQSLPAFEATATVGRHFVILFVCVLVFVASASCIAISS